MSRFAYRRFVHLHTVLEPGQATFVHPLTGCDTALTQSAIQPYLSPSTALPWAWLLPQLGLAVKTPRSFAPAEESRYYARWHRRLDQIALDDGAGVMAKL